MATISPTPTTSAGRVSRAVRGHGGPRRPHAILGRGRSPTASFCSVKKTVYSDKTGSKIRGISADLSVSTRTLQAAISQCPRRRHRARRPSRQLLGHQRAPASGRPGRRPSVCPARERPGCAAADCCSRRPTGERQHGDSPRSRLFFRWLDNPQPLLSPQPRIAMSAGTGRPRPFKCGELGGGSPQAV